LSKEGAGTALHGLPLPTSYEMSGFGTTATSHCAAPNSAYGGKADVEQKDPEGRV
jgi:hypothetical protein